MLTLWLTSAAVGIFSLGFVCGLIANAPVHNDSDTLLEDLIASWRELHGRDPLFDIPVDREWW